jgi:hypothetical protein
MSWNEIEILVHLKLSLLFIDDHNRFSQGRLCNCELKGTSHIVITQSHTNVPNIIILNLCIYNSKYVIDQ